MSTVERVQEGALLTMFAPEEKARRIFETAVTTFQSTLCNIPEDFNFGIFVISKSGRAY